MAAALGIDRFTTDWREVVDDPDVDIVAVLLGETAHREATEAALALGKPVLCEKPLGRDRFEAAALVEAARRAGVHAATGFNYRYMPAMRLAREIVDYGNSIAKLRNEETPEDAWQDLRLFVNALFLRRIDNEILKEMQGVADGAAAAGTWVSSAAPSTAAAPARQACRDLRIAVSSFHASMSGRALLEQAG